MTTISDSTQPTPRDANVAAPHGPDLYEVVARTVSQLQSDYLGERGDRRQAAARGRLAILRRSAGFTPEQHPLAMQEVLDALEPPLRASDLGRGDAPSRTERSAFDAMTLFALHMQSATRGMHLRGRSFGTAAGMLRARTDSASLKPRFDALLAARTERSRLAHARSLVTLLRGHEIGVDYGAFARDLRTLAGPRHAGVLLRWGRDFAMTPRTAEPDRSARDAAAANSTGPA